MRTTLLIVIFLFSGCGSLDPVDWEEQVENLPLDGRAFEMADREAFVYATSWNGIPAGQASFTARRTNDRYETEGEVVTTGLAAMIHGMRLHFEAESGVTDLMSRRWKFDQKDKKTVDIDYSPEDRRIRSRIRAKGELETLDLTGHGLFEPLGAIYALRRTDLKEGRTFRIRMFAERNFYRADILVAKRVTIRVPAGEFDTYFVRADITMTEDGEPIAESRPQAIWLTADERRLPVKVAIQTDIGHIILTMKSYESGEAAPLTP